MALRWLLRQKDLGVLFLVCFYPIEVTKVRLLHEERALTTVVEDNGSFTRFRLDTGSVLDSIRGPPGI